MVGKFVGIVVALQIPWSDYLAEGVAEMTPQFRMTAAATVMRETRIALMGPVDYRYQPGHSGKAAWLNIGRAGAAIRLGRYLSPGRSVFLGFAVGPDGAAVELEGRVAWCRQIPGSDHFVAGLAVLRHTPEAALAFAMLADAARAQGAGAANDEAGRSGWNGLSLPGMAWAGKTPPAVTRWAI